MEGFYFQVYDHFLTNVSQKIDQVKETVFLGVIMDENLNWKSEISLVAKFLNVQELFVNPVSIYLRKPYEHCIFLWSIHTFFTAT